MPGDDLTSALITVHNEDDGRLAEHELVDTLILMLTAGHETTVNLLDQAVFALLTHPDQLALVRAGREVVDGCGRGGAALAGAGRLPAAALRGRGHRRRGRDHPQGRRDPRRICCGWPGSRALRRRARPSSTSPGRASSTCPSVTACTTASARRWPGWRRHIALRALFERFPDLSLTVPVDELSRCIPSCPTDMSPCPHCCAAPQQSIRNSNTITVNQ